MILMPLGAARALSGQRACACLGAGWARHTAVLLLVKRICAPSVTTYSAFFGSVRTSMKCGFLFWSHLALPSCSALHSMRNDQIFVDRYLPTAFFSASKRTPLPIRQPQPEQRTSNGISKRITRMPSSSFFARSRSGCAFHAGPPVFLTSWAARDSLRGSQSGGW